MCQPFDYLFDVSMVIIFSKAILSLFFCRCFSETLFSGKVNSKIFAGSILHPCIFVLFFNQIEIF